ncbi:bifunctional RecB family nuclease/DEAD/DEAH box helicase [Thioalkalivibrio sp. XN279]|uniref:bifunctional RecB family nuclease/DEAD/DEAH box helicase n=1 Tax=Thioalkalivibrio sp. XN279 TaxID=2714953 RepID=UPI00140A9E24|nr:DEAD/DEAH box helicase [Thioalkalivibrio sp. XN279]NHA14599.1 AAA family ATPase [Thioalkalivibrio sp. XN279]
MAFNLYPDNNDYAQKRAQLQMPYPQSPRPGLPQVQRAGDEWQAEKLHDLTQTFGAQSIVGSAYTLQSGQVRYKQIQLAAHLSKTTPTKFIVESTLSIGKTFQQALGVVGHATQYSLQYSELRPDIIEVLPAAKFPSFISADGSISSLPSGDARRQLRIIDIKLSADPSPAYFAEVAFYSMALAGWLHDQGLAGQFVVVPDAAVWPGTHEASKLVQASRQAQRQGVTPSTAQLWAAMQEDLETSPFEVFAFRVRRFFQSDLPRALASHWSALEFHVDNRCSFCEYLGEDRPPSQHDPKVAPHDNHCLPLALSQDHLSRVAFVSQGARLSLNQAGVGHVKSLAQCLGTDPVFDTHQTLRATRTVVAGRASSLQSGTVTIPAQTGSSASMPKWADLRIFLSVDFDIGSAITVAFGLKAFWHEPRAFQSPLTSPRQNRAWRSNARIVIDRDLASEEHELLAFLQEIHDIIQWCQTQDARTLQNPLLAGLTPQRRPDYQTSLQVYIWDSLQYDHLTRVIGRHLQAILANQNLSYLAWLFPPEELLENPDSIVRRSPITIVRDVIRSMLAAPIPHYYSLFEVARLYHQPSLPASVATFNVHPLFATSLSDQIPSERAHEIWSRITTPRHWQQQMQTYVETVKKRLSALETVAQRLETDLKPRLTQSAPVIQIGPPSRQPSTSSDGQLWFAFTKLSKALEELDVQHVRAMPAHERAARFRSARLVQRLVGQPETDALARLGLVPQVGRRVYLLSPDSHDVKAKVGDFSFALVPENAPGLLDRKIAGVVRNTAFDATVNQRLGKRYWHALVEDLTCVTIAGLDRNNGLIALDASALNWPTALDEFQASGLVNLEQNVVLDPVHNDFFTKKLDVTLKAIGNPTIASSKPLVMRATGQAGARARRSRKQVPAAEFLWSPATLATSVVSRSLGNVRAQLTTHGLTLNNGQWQAWQDALTHRARLVWGPPGTGKSRTVRAIAVGAVLEALESNRPFRVLVSAFTYTAIDNVLLEIARDLAALAPGACDVFRVRSRYQANPGNIAPTIDLELNKGVPSLVLRALRARLQQPNGVVVVGATSEQVHNLLTTENGRATSEFFDLILIDEASQMDVAHSILAIASIANGGSVVLAGDPLQLSPIQQAEAPKGLEDFVGSIYGFWKELHQIPESPLSVNYRSNDCIVGLARQSGYQATLTSHSPALELNFLSPTPTAQPATWDARLFWTHEWADILNPSRPAVCFVYEDGRSSQRNDFEADAVASMLLLLHGQMADQLRNENDAGTGQPIPPTTTAYSAIDFFRKAVGVVTPHRAQQALIVTRLLQVFGATGALAEAIRESVDTVERFQGQQRDIIIASYSLGDPDQIAEEDEFLMSLNRFNVIASRARAKFVVLVSEEVIGHLAHDIAVLRESRLLKYFAESFCGNVRPMSLGYHGSNGRVDVPGEFRWA